MITDVFCKIISGELPAEVVFRDEDFVVMKDIAPQAPVHLLIVPIKHFEGLADFHADDAAILGKALLLAKMMATEQGLRNGYRLILNEGEHGGKLVPHMHFHLLGGKRLGAKIVQG